MHELEAILHEYLSFNWDRMEEMNSANAPLQRKEGLACPWRPSKDIDHSVSILLKAFSSKQWPFLLRLASPIVAMTGLQAAVCNLFPYCGTGHMMH